MSDQLGSELQPLRVAIVGAGPSGFYAAGALQSKQKELGLHIAIDMFDKLIAPHGLVRYGVAPDHQNIKAVSKVYDRIAADPNFRYFGNVEFCNHLHLEDFQKHYNAILFAVGAQSDRRRGRAHAGSLERNSAMTDLLTSRLLISVSVHRLPQRGLCCFRLGLPWEPAVGMGER